MLHNDIKKNETDIQKIETYLENYDTNSVTLTKPEAAKLLKKILREDPNNSDAHLYAAMLTIRDAVPTGAFNINKELEKSIELGNETAKIQKAVYILFSADEEKKNKLQALTILEEAGEKNDILALHNLAAYSLQEDNLEKRIYYLEKIIKLHQERNKELTKITREAYISLGKLYCQIGLAFPEYFDKADETFAAIEKQDTQAEYLRNDIKFKRLLKTTEPARAKVLYNIWIDKLKKLSDKGCCRAKLNLGSLYLKIYGDNPFINTERDLNLAEKYLLDAFKQDKSGNAAFLLYRTYTLLQKPKIGRCYLEIAAQYGDAEAELIHGDLLIREGKAREGALFVDSSVKKKFQGALFWYFKYYHTVWEMEHDPKRKLRLQVEMINKLEIAAAAGSVEAQLVAARCALENRYTDHEESYEERMLRGKTYLENVLKNNNYLYFPNLSEQKKTAEHYLSLWDQAFNNRLTYSFDETGKNACLEAEIKNEEGSNKNIQSTEVKKRNNKKKKLDKNIISFPPINHKQKAIFTPEITESFPLSLEDILGVKKIKKVKPKQELNETKVIQEEKVKIEKDVVKEEKIIEIEEMADLTIESKTEDHITSEAVLEIQSAFVELPTEIIPPNIIPRSTEDERVIPPDLHNNISELPELFSHLKPALEFMPSSNELALIDSLCNPLNLTSYLDSLLQDKINENPDLTRRIFKNLPPLSNFWYETFVARYFMQGNANASYQKFMQHGVMEYLFPIIDYNDASSLKWLEENFIKTDIMFKSQKRLSSTYIYGYLLAAARQKVSLHNLVDLWCIPSLVKKELSDNNFAILMRFLTTRFPNYKIIEDISLNSISISAVPNTFFHQRNINNISQNTETMMLRQIDISTNHRL